MMRRFLGRSALRPAGFALVVIALVLLGRSLYARNAYEIILSALALLLWLALFFTGLYWAKKHAAMEPLWKPDFPVTAHTYGETAIAGLGVKTPWFFRMHFLVRGRFYPQGISRGCPVRAETSAARGEDTALLKLGFPMGGIFRGDGFCRLRDIFGFFSFECGVRRHQVFNIRNAPCDSKKLLLSALSGAEDRRNKSSSDEERYYMREYSPGDRFRDINWKSSERIDTLITRISPDNQEKISRIEVRFRNFGPVEEAAGGSVSLGELWLLDRAKARLAWFLRSVKDAEASYIFAIRTAEEDFEITDEDELDAFLETLAAMPYAPPRNEDFSGGAASSGELYIFSTACDSGLGGFMLAQRPRPLTLFLARFTETKRLEQQYAEAKFFEQGAAGHDAEKTSHPVTRNANTLLIRDFPVQGIYPFPRWLRSKTERRAQAGSGSRLEIDYAEVRL